MREKRKTLEKNFKGLKFKKISKKQKLQERGITLIALVVTIIILLILAGVTLNIALSDNGLFDKTKKAAEDYKEAQNDEEDAIRQIATQMYSEYVEATVEGYEPASKDGGVTIDGTTSGLSGKTDDKGNVIAGVEDDGKQTFKVDEEMKWRVWDFDGNTLRIIGDPTEDTLTLQGAAGYNNGVWAIEKICRELYSNEDKGAIATSLKRTDIQKVSTYDYTKYKHDKNGFEEDTTSSDDGNLIHFGESKTYPENNKYPKMWNDNDKNWEYGYDSENKSETGSDAECKIWERQGKGEGKLDSNLTKGDNNTIFKESYYFHKYQKNEFPNQKYYDLIFGVLDCEKGYSDVWFAGRCVRFLGDYCYFGIQGMYSDASENCAVNGSGLCHSKNLPKFRYACVTPISIYQSKGE